MNYTKYNKELFNTELKKINGMYNCHLREPMSNYLTMNMFSWNCPINSICDHQTHNAKMLFRNYPRNINDREGSIKSKSETAIDGILPINNIIINFLLIVE